MWYFPMLAPWYWPFSFSSQDSRMQPWPARTKRWMLAYLSPEPQLQITRVPLPDRPRPCQRREVVQKWGSHKTNLSFLSPPPVAPRCLISSGSQVSHVNGFRGIPNGRGAAIWNRISDGWPSWVCRNGNLWPNLWSHKTLKNGHVSVINSPRSAH